jgi:hypothetical protein
MSDRRSRVWLVTIIVVGAPAFFVFPYLLPETLSRFDRGLAFAVLGVAIAALAEAVARFLTRRAS